MSNDKHINGYIMARSFNFFNDLEIIANAYFDDIQVRKKSVVKTFASPYSIAKAVKSDSRNYYQIKQMRIYNLAYLWFGN